METLMSSDIHLDNLEELDNPTKPDTIQVFLSESRSQSYSMENDKSSELDNNNLFIQGLTLPE